MQSSSKVKVVNIREKLALFTDFWSPKVIGELNDHKVQAVRLKGEFVWHHHEKEDELFWVIRGKLIIHFRDRDIEVNPGEFVIIPHLLEHKPEAPEEVEIILIEPKGAVNTGNVTGEKTVTHQDKI
ncbi:mannose-6-phosphate isomerase [Candidatus Gottesmanbacteria bacterium RBG_16_52_11]|uniref:Mannose-6-phosphate isomerase n=1 Tax=Candidatus Gottesmanbacteria bacterium RBG_16_52_11 TaxID=1798374 RepID=A0A1F5YXF2_9BACT|nr:MAG: mannose-6-phosphate isomerase [Candidatus Gottesmanbacteria bacterium RBG_16_52_11]